MVPDSSGGRGAEAAGAQGGVGASVARARRAAALEAALRRPALEVLGAAFAFDEVRHAEPASAEPAPAVALRAVGSHAALAEARSLSAAPLEAEERVAAVLGSRAGLTEPELRLASELTAGALATARVDPPTRVAKPHGSAGRGVREARATERAIAVAEPARARSHHPTAEDAGLPELRLSEAAIVRRPNAERVCFAAVDLAGLADPRARSAARRAPERVEDAVGLGHAAAVGAGLADERSAGEDVAAAFEERGR